LPGGFVDYGESGSAAVREARNLPGCGLTEQFYTYSDPSRDPRHHTVSIVFIAVAEGAPQGADDAKTARVFREDEIPAPIVFDHARIVREYFIFKKTGRRPKP
jgi:8-oxo-dGTP diphosphatase